MTVATLPGAVVNMVWPGGVPPFEMVTIVINQDKNHGKILEEMVTM